MKVYIFVYIVHEALLFRSTRDMMCIEDAVDCIVTWPANKVFLDKSPERAKQSVSSTSVKFLISFTI